jgi:hypothetical protein
MGLAEKDKIDLIVKRPGVDAFDLIAFDDGTEADEIHRYNLVIEKLCTYLSYVRSGQFEEGYPQAKAKAVRCVVICLRPPNDAMKQLEAIKDPEDTTWRLPVVVLEQSQYVQKPPPKSKPWWQIW